MPGVDKDYLLIKPMRRWSWRTKDRLHVAFVVTLTVAQYAFWAYCGWQIGLALKACAS
jgi:hypothetical protein